MPIPDETIRLQLTRYGDRWDLASAQRNHHLGALEADGDLVSTVAAELRGVADHPPGVVLEATARILDYREAERLGALPPRSSGELEAAGDVARLVELLEDGVPRDVPSIARRLVIPDARVRRAIAQAAADDVVEPWTRHGLGLERVWGEVPSSDVEGFLWKIARDVAELDERTPLERLADDQRAAAQDDPRGEADR